MIGKVNNVIVLSKKPLGDDFFKCWLILLRPLHKLTDREIDVTASFIKQRYYLSKSIKDINILEEVLMSEETKRKVREECCITSAHFQVIMGKLRKNNVIVNNRINQKLIPNLTEDTENLQLLVSFPIK